MLVLLGVLALAGGYFVMQKARQAGIDPALMKQNPALATAKLITAMNPNLETISVDESKGTITVRDKSTGKLLTANLSDARKGKFVFQEEGKEAVTVETNGDGASGHVKVTSGDGTMTMGANAGKLPGWLSAYPGASVEANLSAEGKDGFSGNFTFKTKDAADKVIQFYTDALKNAGLKVTTNATQQEGKNSGGMLSAEDEGKKRSIVIFVGNEGDETNVNLQVQEKK